MPTAPIRRVIRRMNQAKKLLLLAFLLIFLLGLCHLSSPPFRLSIERRYRLRSAPSEKSPRPHQARNRFFCRRTGGGLLEDRRDRVIFYLPEAASGEFAAPGAAVPEEPGVPADAAAPALDGAELPDVVAGVVAPAVAGALPPAGAAAPVGAAGVGGAAGGGESLSSARFSSSTFTRGSPRKPNCRPSVLSSISFSTCSFESLRSRATWTA